MPGIIRNMDSKLIFVPGFILLVLQGVNCGNQEFCGNENKYESPWEPKSHSESIGHHYLNCKKVSKGPGRCSSGECLGQTESQVQG